MIKVLRVFLSCILSLLIISSVSVVQAEEKEKEEEALPEIEVVAEPLVEDKAKISIKTETLPSQVQIITKEEIERLNVKDYTDLFRKVPGMKAFTYGQGDIGHPLSMRGYPSGHGRDVAIFVDGVPQNFPSAAQGGHGMSDMSWLTPEMIERIEVIKGPFSALYGDQALAGAINIITKNKDKSPSISSWGGSFGAFRGSTVISKETWTPAPFLSYEYYKTDGYRDNSDYERLSLFNKVTLPLWDGDLSLRFFYYKSDWYFPGYLSVDDVKKGIVDRKSAVNPTDWGKHKRYGLVLNYSSARKEDGLYINAYVEDYEKNVFRTFPPAHQREQFDDRRIFGGRIFYNLTFKESVAITPGVEIRFDDGDAQHYNTTDRRRIKTVSDYGIKQLNLAAFLQAQAKVVEFLKIVGGVRYDYFGIDIENRTSLLNSGEGNPSIFSPKIGFVLTPFKGLNIFANKGLGFRSPAASEMSPSTATGIKNFDLRPAKVDTWDIGFNTLLFEKLYLAADYYQTDMEREIRVIADQAINVGDSKRDGYEIETKFYATSEISLFASYAWVNARVKNPVTPGQDRVTGVPEDLISCGIEITKSLGRDRRLLADLYYKYISGAPYYAVTQVTPTISPPFDIYNFRLTYDVKKWSLFASTVYQPREYSSEIIGMRAGRLTFDPRPKWDLQAGVKYQF